MVGEIFLGGEPMTGKLWIRYVVMAALLSMVWGPAAAASGFNYAGFSREAGLRLGYGKSLRKASVHLYSLFPRWGLFLIKPGNTLPGGLGISFVVEGVFSIAEAEETGWELGATPMLKLSLPIFSRVLLFVEGGAGVILENINSPAIAHTFNFTPQIGGGVDIALSPRLGLTMAYRYRHSFNAGLYDENPAFNINLFQAGLTYYY